MKRVITILAAVALVAAIPTLASVSVALAQPGGAETPEEYAGVILTLAVSALGCLACLLTLHDARRERAGRMAMTARLLLAGVGPLAIIGALYALAFSSSAPLIALLIALLNLLDPAILWVVICALAIAAPLFALATTRGWCLAALTGGSQAR